MPPLPAGHRIPAGVRQFKKGVAEPIRPHLTEALPLHGVADAHGTGCLGGGVRPLSRDLHGPVAAERVRRRPRHDAQLRLARTQPPGRGVRARLGFETRQRGITGLEVDRALARVPRVARAQRRRHTQDKDTQTPASYRGSFHPNDATGARDTPTIVGSRHVMSRGRRQGTAVDDEQAPLCEEALPMRLARHRVAGNAPVR